MTATTKQKQYIYIVQAAKEPTRCKIGKTNDLERRLKEYNAITGKSKDNAYEYLFACEVKNMTQVENAVKEQFSTHREEASREIYFCNKPFLKDYINFIKSHKLFVKEIIVKTETKTEIIKIVKRLTPSLEEREITRKDVLQNAKRLKNNEFYTRYEDIEKEISMYDKKIWKNKTVFCNCDDAVGDTETRTSAFSLYFIRNFKSLGLKKLICTHYSGPYDLFSAGAKGYIFTKDGYSEFKKYPDDYNGSFDHPLSLKILNEEADIVCTNPPFSETTDYWDITIKSGKKFLIISNEAIILTAAYIPFFKNKQAWAGHNSVYCFLNPKREPVRAAGRWFTNIPIKNRSNWARLKIMPLKNIPEKYKKYDDKKVLLIDGGYIPSDYKKSFGVSSNPILNGLLEKGYEIVEDKEYYPYINGKKCYSRVLVQKI